MQEQIKQITISTEGQDHGFDKKEKFKEVIYFS